MNIYSYEYDIAVFGAGPAGLATAITAARHGVKVILFEKNGYLGGTLATGISPLGFFNEDGRQCIAGFGNELIERLTSKGHSYGHRVCPKHNSVSNLHPDYVKILAIEMCNEANVDIILHCETNEVIVNNGRISSVKLYGKCNQITVTAKCYVDCTGDGDVAYLAGCTYEKGQKGNGILQPPTVVFTLENVNNEELFSYVEKHPEEMTFNKIMAIKPGYDANYFRSNPNFIFVGLTALFNRLREQKELPIIRENLIIINGLNPGEVYVNSTRILNIDATNIKDLTRAELEGQLQVPKLIEMLKKHVPGFQNCFLSSICPTLSVRETRRISGIKRIEIDQAFNGEVPPDSIALSGYKIDIHSGINNTTEFKTIKKPFGIPYGCLVSNEIENLMFAGRCISTDAQVIGSTRVMPSCMAMGQAAGVGAVTAIKDNKLPGEVDINKVRDILKDEGAILSMDESFRDI